MKQYVCCHNQICDEAGSVYGTKIKTQYKMVTYVSIDQRVYQIIFIQMTVLLLWLPAEAINILDIICKYSDMWINAKYLPPRK